MIMKLLKDSSCSVELFSMGYLLALQSQTKQLSVYGICSDHKFLVVMWFFILISSFARDPLSDYLKKYQCSWNNVVEA